MKYILLIFSISSLLSCSLITKRKSTAIRSLWTVKAGVSSSSLRTRLFHNTSPVFAGEFVIQGNGWDGIQAFEKKSGKQVWVYKIKGGVSSPVTVSGDKIYFGGADGFVYALKAKTGQMVWRFFTGSENMGAPVVQGKGVYFVSSSQKIYALSEKNGKLLWLYAGPALSGDFFIRGSYRPAVSKHILYGGFYEGSLVALYIKNGRLKWKRKPVSALSSNPALSRGLFLEGPCLLAPVFGEGLFCLNPKTGRTLWKGAGGETNPVTKGTHLYQGDKEKLYSLRKFDGKINWSVKAKASVTPSLYKNVLLYGLSSNGKIYAVDFNTGKLILTFPFGRGLSAPITVDHEAGEAYFFTVDGHLHKVQLIF
ncbi:MAG: PQQ-binding-like beta-propeller repeat protein [Bdellovibrionales bacterium]|nr:PQQ-binding-like beta-propeller repeat protein [Bdellovibrionales bacterium]